MIEELKTEINRNKGLIPMYEAVGPVGQPAKLMIEHDIKTAEEALTSGDTVQMIRSLVTLRGNKA